MTHDDALLWLSDRFGKSVNVSVELDRGDVGTVVLEGEGTLEHWSEPIDERARALVVPEGRPRRLVPGRRYPLRPH